jgi:hypothetical protein
MDVFALIVVLGLLGALLFLAWVGFMSRDQPIGDVIDKKANQRWATQAMIEAGEVPQMVEAANEYRRKQGLSELTVEDFRGMAQEQQRVAIEQAKKQQRSRGS